MKYNSRIKKASMLILSVMILTIIAMTANTVAFAEEIKKEVVTPKLNSKVTFEGKTYLLPNRDTVRKEYKQGQDGVGIISIISKNAKHQVYVTGEGWIDPSQIKEMTQYITIKFEQKEGKNGIGAKLVIDGEFLDVDSTNSGVVEYKDGVLVIKGDGKATVNITTKDGKTIEALATVVDGEMTLDIPQKEISADIDAKAEVADKKVVVNTDGDANAKIEIGQDGINIAGEGNGKVTVEADNKEIASAEGNANANAGVDKEGVHADAETEGSMTLFQRLMAKVTGRTHAEANKNGVNAEAEGSASASVDGKELAGAEGSAHAGVNKEGANAGAEGSATITDKEVAEGEVEIRHEIGNIDPEADVRVEIVDREIVNENEIPLPIYSAIGELIRAAIVAK